MNAIINHEPLAEYLVTNGIGGYASSTIINLNTRKYHGLLIGEYNKERYVFLSGIDERIEINGKIYELGTHHYKGDYNANKGDIFFPLGFKFLKNYELKNFPKFYYEVEDIEIEKEILMPHQSSTSIIHYKIKNNSKNKFKFSLFPLLNMRSLNANLHLSSPKEFLCEESKNAIIVKHNEINVKLQISSKSPTNFLKKEYILWNVFYKEEKERGYDCFEDLYCPGCFETLITQRKEEITLMATTDVNAVEELNYAKIKEYEISRLKNLTALNAFKNDKIFQEISILADKFIIKLNEEYGIIAGYHWFGEWGRDTMISIPGLCIATGRQEIARNIIKRWLNFLNNGLIPNFISEKSFAFNSSDASLWLFNAVYHYYIFTGDLKFIEEIYQKLIEIIEGYIKGNNACMMDYDSLIISYAQTTWMDTKFTKREGKVVEINALWFNALNILKFFSRLLNKNFSYDEILNNVKKNFEIFWNEEKKCLYDVIDEKRSIYDDSIRPNQIFTISLPFNVINNKKGEKIFNVVFEELYTPYGLRTLNKNNANYIGIYEGNEEERDRAYHNGTVWPWLMGSFIEAYLKINKYSDESKNNSLKFLKSLIEYAQKFYTIPEIFDGDFPHKSRGCIAQAWSVAELIRALKLINKNLL